MRWRLFRDHRVEALIGIGAVVVIAVVTTVWIAGHARSRRADTAANVASRSPSDSSGPQTAPESAGGSGASSSSGGSGAASASGSGGASASAGGGSSKGKDAGKSPNTTNSSNKAKSSQPRSTGSTSTSASPATTSAAGAGLPVAQPSSCPKATITVRTSAQLSAALAAAKPGDSIVLAPGVYTGNFVATASGTASQPIYLCGARDAILDGGTVTVGYALYLNPARYWRVIGFSIRNAQKGVVTDGTTHSVIQDLSVHDIGDEGIHLRSASTYTVVLNNTVTRTGLHDAKFGEGIYVGSARSNWSKYGGGGPDRSDHNVIQGNTISFTSAESIDIKEGTTDGAALGNSFDGTGMHGADSWVDVKGNNWLIAGNTGRNAPTDGFQTHQIVDGWGTGNVFRDNTAAVNGPGYAFHLTPIAQNVVSCGNRFSGAAQGLTNATCTA
jgi:hypothetical protein